MSLEPERKTPDEADVLACLLRHEPASEVKEIARRLRTSFSTANRRVYSLKDKGYVYFRWRAFGNAGGGVTFVRDICLCRPLSLSVYLMQKAIEGEKHE